MESSFLELMDFAGVASRSYGENLDFDVLFLQHFHDVVHCLSRFSVDKVPA
jgi:hypothetical protein